MHGLHDRLRENSSDDSVRTLVPIHTPCLVRGPARSRCRNGVGPVARGSGDAPGAAEELAAHQARVHEVHRDQPLQRRHRFHEGDGRGLAADPPHDLRVHLRRPGAAAGGHRRAGCDAGAGARDGEDPHLRPGQHPCGRGRGKRGDALAAPIDCEGRARAVVQVRRAARQSDLQRRRERARERRESRDPERADRRDGHPQQRAGTRPEQGLHETGDRRGAIAGDAAQPVRPSRGDRPSHHRRQRRQRLLPDLRVVDQPQQLEGHRRAAARQPPAGHHEGGQGEARMGLLLLRRRDARRIGAGVGIRRRAGSAALHVDLLRSPQPARAPERNVLLRLVRGPDQGQLLVRRGSGRLRGEALRVGPEGRGRRRRRVDHRQAARRAPATGEGTAAEGNRVRPDGHRAQPVCPRPAVPPPGRRHRDSRIHGSLRHDGGD